MFSTNQNIFSFAKRAGTSALLGATLLGLAACTTVEGTNAFKDGNTFEREVMSETLRGLGVLEREEKEDISAPTRTFGLAKRYKIFANPN